MVGGDGIELPVPQILVTALAQQGSDPAGVVVVVNGKAPPSGQPPAHAAATVLAGEDLVVLAGDEAVGFLDILVMGSVFPSLEFGS